MFEYNGKGLLFQIRGSGNQEMQRYPDASKP